MMENGTGQHVVRLAEMKKVKGVVFGGFGTSLPAPCG